MQLLANVMKMLRFFLIGPLSWVKLFLKTFKVYLNVIITLKQP